MLAMAGEGLLSTAGGLLPALADLIYPAGRSCLWCGGASAGPGRPFCSDCLEAMTGEGPVRVDQEIRRGASLSRAIGVGTYDGPLKEAIHRLKFAGWTFLFPTLGELLVEAVGAGGLWTADVVVPVPLHPRRLVDRGFNQAAGLAGTVSKAFGLPMAADGLARRRPTRSQVELGPRERGRNVAGAFEVTRPGYFFGARVLLIDDVLTTGATAGECARALLEDGASAADLAVLAVAGGSEAK